MFNSHIQSRKHACDMLPVKDAAGVCWQDVVEVGGHLREGEVRHPGQGAGGPRVQRDQSVEAAQQLPPLREAHQFVERLEFSDKYIELFTWILLPRLFNKRRE